MKRTVFLLTFLSFCAGISAQKNFTFLGKKTYTTDLSDIWGYAANGKEYALVGVYNGVSIVDVTTPTNPVELFFISGPNTYWRDIKTWGHYAYVTNEASGGLLIIDLGSLPSNISSNTWTGGSLGLSSAHNIFIDENGIGYILGANPSAGHGAIFLDMTTNPTNPSVLGKYNVRYVHDIYVRNDTMWSAEINDGIFSVVDVSDKSAPVVLATHATPSNFTHNLWLSNDSKTLLTTDEKSNAVIAAYNVSDLNNITELDRYQSNPGNNVIPHNVFYVNQDFGIISYYRDGVIILDVSHPNNLIETGNYDTSPLSGNGFNGAWGVYPWLPSGNVIVTDIEEGLFVLGPVYMKACYLEGTVTDLNSGTPLNNVTVEITSNSQQANTNLTGQYRTGIADSGTYTVQFSKTGYVTHVENNVVLKNGITKVLNVQLIPAVSITLSGQVLDSATGMGIPGANVLFVSSDNTYQTTANANGIFSFNSFFTGYYEIYAGKWGHITEKKNVTIFSSGNNVTFRLDSGYYDDYLFNFNWTISSNATSGIWERGEPVGTLYNSVPSNPEFDVTNDFGDQCFVTGNGGGAAGDDDVDDGSTVLTSPVFDLSSYNDPHIKYSRWFYNDGGSGTPNDQLQVKITNGSSTVTVETINGSATSNNWLQSDIRVIDFLPPGPNMQIIFDVGDLGTQHLVEAGVDLFYITDTNTIFAPTVDFAANVTEACPGDSVHFTDLSTRSPYAWLWQFSGSAPSSSTEQNPVVVFNNPGVYNITLTATNDGGSNSSVKTSFIIIHDTPALTMKADSVSCPGGSDGSAMVSAANGAGNYGYHWSTGSQLDSVISLPSGNYTVTVTDMNGCSSSGNVFVNQPAPISIAANTIDATCGDQNGAIDLSVSGGTPPYAYIWNTSNSGTNISGLSAGTYYLTVIDIHQCADSGSFSISNINGPTVTINVNDVSCNGGNDGAIHLNISGGTAPISYSWASGFSVQNLSNLHAGNYFVTVSDSNNCMTIKNISLAQPAKLTASVAVLNSTCGNTNGKVFAYANGGTPPYSFLWDNSSTGDSLLQLAPGNYSITITDDHSCQTDTMVILSNIPGPTLDAEISQINCYGGGDGIIHVTTTGGIPPFVFNWSNGFTGSTLTNLSEDNYAVTVNDANGCSAGSNYSIEQPDSISISLTIKAASSPAVHDGSVEISVAGGTPPYIYDWSGSDNDSLSQGNYFVTVADLNGCSKTVAFDVGVVSGVAEIKETSFLLYPNPFSNEIRFESGRKNEFFYITIFNVQGQKVDSFELTGSNNAVWGNEFDNGIYLVEISTDSEIEFFKIIKAK